MAHGENMGLFNTVLESFRDKFENKKMVILPNAIFIPGIGGSGKTSVVDKALMEENDWVSGPTTTQTDNLFKIASEKGIKVKPLSKEDLFKVILQTEYGTYKGKIKEENSDDGGYSEIEGIEVFAIKNAPKHLLIDEVTLYSNAEL
jgi:hypothetical protein